MNSRKPIWNARRSSEVTNAGTMTAKSRSVTPARSAGARIFSVRAWNDARSRGVGVLEEELAQRLLARGRRRRRARDSVSALAMSAPAAAPSAGAIASYIRSPVGAMTAIVSTSARPVSTWVGGTDGVPMALRRIDSTTEMRTNDVTMSSANGISDSAAIARISTSGREASPRRAPAARGPRRRAAAGIGGDDAAPANSAHASYRLHGRVGLASAAARLAASETRASTSAKRAPGALRAASAACPRRARRAAPSARRRRRPGSSAPRSR